MKTVTIEIPDDYDIQIVRKEEKSVIRTYQDLINNQIKFNGYFIGLNSSIYNTSGCYLETNKNMAASKKVAKSMLAMAMISQLMPYYGGEITDEEWDGSRKKYTIEREGNEIVIAYHCLYYAFLAFHTKEQRDNFLKYNEQLVKDYLMID